MILQPTGEAPASIPVVVDNVQVVEEHHGVETRLQVSADGRKLEEVPLQPLTAEALDAQRFKKPLVQSAVTKFFVQVGAFAQEANAKELLSQLAHIGQNAHIDAGPLYKVRIGPFDTREQAIQARGRLETAGQTQTKELAFGDRRRAIKKCPVISAQCPESHRNSTGHWALGTGHF